MRILPLLFLLLLVAPAMAAAPLAICSSDAAPGTYIFRGTWVKFYNLSVAKPHCTTNSWNFGDSETASGDNPEHYYWDAGDPGETQHNYTVTYTCTSADGTDVNYTWVLVMREYRPTAAHTIETRDTSAMTTLEAAMGGFNVSNPTDISWLTIFATAAGSYTAILGNIAFVIIFAIPFVMMWILQRNLTLPGVVGIILGGFIIARLPAEYHLVAVAFISLSIVAVIYSLLKERM